MFNLEHLLVVALLGVSFMQSMNNHKLEKENEKLRVALAYKTASTEANSTREAIFTEANETITRRYNEEVEDINNTAIGSTINFDD